MALAFFATMTIAGSALIASRMIKSKPGGARLFLQRKNIQLAHKIGLLNDFQAATAYEDLRRHYLKLIPPKPIVLVETVRSGDQKRALFYTGPFRPEMTHREARLVMGVTETEAKDAKLITKKWRSMMLKNHPDTGGSPFVAAKINEAKEIIMGEKTAKEGGDDDDEDGSSGSAVNPDETPEEAAKRKEEERRKEDDAFDVDTPEPKPQNPDIGPLKDHPVPPLYTWKQVEVEEAPKTASPRTNWNLKEDTFHRKATRVNPGFQAIDDPSIFPTEKWKLDYLKDMQELEDKEKEAEKKQLNWVRDHPNPGAPVHELHGHWEDSEGNPVKHTPEFMFEEEMAKDMRQRKANEEYYQAQDRMSAIERIKRTAERQARMRKASEQTQSGSKKF